MSTSASSAPDVHSWQQPAGHTVFPVNEWPLDNGPNLVYAIATLGDSANYCYAIVDKDSGQTALVDPAESNVVIETMERLSAWHKKHNNNQELKITHVLTTHKHWDHAGGNSAVKSHYSNIEVIGGKDDNVEAATKHVKGGDTIQLGKSEIKVFDAPCHTRGHVLYYTGRSVFTGDTMFTAGCGRMFEGTPAEMYHNLMDTIVGQLPAETYALVGHEYTKSNLEFCHWLEPNNKVISDKLQYAKQRREHKLPLIPTTLEEEKQYNVFLRVKEPSVRERVSKLAGKQLNDDVEIFAWIRKAKDDSLHTKQSSL